MYNKFPTLFKRKNMEIGYVDTDSIIFKTKNMKTEEYQDIQKVILIYLDVRLD